MSNEITLEDELLNVVTNSIKKQIARGSWLIVRGGSVEVDKNFLQDIYKSVDMEKVKQSLVPLIENKIAENIFNSMATEISNDVKKILSDRDLRDRFRFFLRSEIEKIEGVVNE